MPAGPYNGNNLHPYCDNTGEVYDCFWENVGYIGKKHFRGNRNVYAEGCYWSDVNPEDLWEGKKRCDKDDGNYNYKYHGTWKEQEDQNREYREWQEQNPPQEGMYEAYTVYEERLDEEEADMPALEEESDSEDEIEELIEIRHPDRPRYHNGARTHYFWNDLWGRIPRDEATDEWRKEKPVQEVTQALQVTEEVQIKAKRLTATAKIPQRKTEGAAGYDLVADHEATVPARDRALIGTGIALELPAGRHGEIKPRSSLAVAGITIDGGIIDEDYTGEVIVIMVNTTTVLFRVIPRDRIAQLIVMRNETVQIKEVQELTRTQRGGRGFGSTGRREVAANAVLTRIEHEEYASKHCYTVNPELTPEQEDQVRTTLKRYEEIIAISYDDLPADTQIKHDIDTGDAKPIRQVPYRTPPAYDNWIQQHINDLQK